MKHVNSQHNQEMRLPPRLEVQLEAASKHQRAKGKCLVEFIDTVLLVVTLRSLNCPFESLIILPDGTKGSTHGYSQG